MDQNNCCARRRYNRLCGKYSSAGAAAIFLEVSDPNRIIFLYLQISKDDRLPQKICSVCISYLKHATIFRQQALDNIRNLKTAKDGELTKPINDSSPDSPDAGNNEKFFKSNVMFANSNMNLDAYEQIKHELDLFFGDNTIQEEDDEYDEVESDDGDDEDAEQRILSGIVSNGKAETVKSAIHNFFNYSERTFEEDDLSIDGIGISEPDDHKERKCHACKRIFLLNDSFDDHMKECIEAKLFSFITDCHQLAVIKKHKAISAQEFIRRMIFALKSIVKSLAMCYRVLSGPTANVSATPADQRLNNMRDGTAIVKEKTLPKQLFNEMDNILRPPPELTARPPARLTVIPATAPKPDKNFPKIRNFVAKCPSCKQIFDSIQALETHNQQLHNSRRGIYGRSNETPTTSVSSSDNVSDASNQLRDLLNSDDYATDGIVDVMRLHQRSPNVLNIRVSKDYNSRSGF